MLLQDTPAATPAVTAESILALIRDAWLERYNDLSRAAAMARKARDQAQAIGATALVLHAELLQTTCANMTETMEPATLQANYQRICAAFEQLGERDGYVLATSQLAVFHLRQGEVEIGKALIEPLQPGVDAIGDAVLRFLAGYHLMYFRSLEGRVDAVIRGYFALDELARRVGVPIMRAITYTGLGTMLVESGDPQSALPYAQHVMELLDKHGITGMRPLCTANLAECLLLMGEHEEACRILAPWLDGAAETHKGHRHFFLMIAAQAHAAIGKTAEADALLAEAERIDIDEVRQRLHGRLIAGLIAQQNGHAVRAQEILAEGEALLDKTAQGDVYYAIQIYLTRARLFEAAGDWRSAAHYLELHRKAYTEGQASASKARVLSTKVQIELEEERVRTAHTDGLTGLPNWQHLRQTGDEMLLHPEARPAVLVLNVQRFKAINDALGRDHGDEVLRAVGQRLAGIEAPAGMCVGRLHADRFCMLWPDATALPALARTLEALFATPVQAGGEPIDIALSVGCAQAPRDGRNMQQLMGHAEVALHVDSERKLGWVDYEPAFKPAQRSELALLSELRRATEEDELRVFLQPKVRLRDGAIISAEALVRWQHPQRGLMGPGAFIPFAEQTGNIGRVTRWMMRAVMQLAAQWRREGRPLQLSMNAATADLRDPGFVEQARTLLAETGAQAGDIRIEITESGVMDDPAATLATLHRLREAGFSLAIDDFGTGQSSLAYLQKMPVQELKIDRAFIANVRPQTDAANLLQATIAFGKAMGLVTVAEGAETAKEWTLLECLGCDYAQGWFAAKPMAVEDFLRWKQDNEPFINGAA